MGIEPTRPSSSKTSLVLKTKQGTSPDPPPRRLYLNAAKPLGDLLSISSSLFIRRHNRTIGNALLQKIEKGVGFNKQLTLSGEIHTHVPK